MASSWFVESKQDVSAESWETKFQVADATKHIQMDCRVFYNRDYHQCPQFRIDFIWLDGLVGIDVGGGPESIIDFPEGEPMVDVRTSQVQEVIDILLGRIQGARFKFEYPDPEEETERCTLNDFLEEAVDDVEEGFRW